MNCPNCNAPLEDGARFCASCGTAIPAQAPEAAPQQPSAGYQAYQQPNQGQTNNVYQQPNQAQQPTGGYCRNCGNQLYAGAAICTRCGAAVGNGTSYCPNCGVPTSPMAAVCTNCGVALNNRAGGGVAGPNAKSKMVAGLLGIFLGGFGVHNFYLGYGLKGGLQVGLWALGLILSCFVIGIFMCLGASIWGLVEGIMILVGKIDKDGKGNPLRD